MNTHAPKQLNSIITKEFNVFLYQTKFLPYIVQIYISIRIKTYSLMVGYPVSKRLDVLKLVVYGTLGEPWGLVGKYFQQTHASPSIRDSVKQVGPETKSNRRYNSVIGVFGLTLKHGDSPLDFLPLRCMFEHSSGAALIPYPVIVREM